MKWSSLGATARLWWSLALLALLALAPFLCTLAAGLVAFVLRCDPATYANTGASEKVRRTRRDARSPRSAANRLAAMTARRRKHWGWGFEDQQATPTVSVWLLISFARTSRPSRTPAPG